MKFYMLICMRDDKPTYIIGSHNRVFCITVGLKGQEEFSKVGMKYTIKHGIKW